MYCVYVLKSVKSGRKYIGHTNDINRRIEDHDRGKNRSVKGRGPFKLVYKEYYDNRLLAINREKQLKSYKGGNALKRLLKEYDPIV